MSDQEKYKEGQKKCGIEVGDTVRVVKKAASYEDGWSLPWVRGMDGWVGKEFTVREIHTTCPRISLENTNGDWWNFPYFVLAIVKKAHGSVPGKVKDNTKEPCRDCKHLDSDVCDDCPTFDGSCTCHTGNPPCSYCENSLWEELIETISTNRKESNMSVQEQKVFDVTIIERMEVLHEGSGVVQKINRTVLFDEKVSAVGDEAAKQKALCGLTVVDFDRLEITCSPFCG